MSPTRTPDTRTVWPWPGVTACAVANSALIRNGAPSHGNRRRWWASTYPPTAGRDGRQRDDRREVAQVLADRAPHFVSSCSLAGTSETLRSRPCCLISVRRKSTRVLQRLLQLVERRRRQREPVRAGLRDRAQVGRLLGLARHVGPQRRALVVLRDRRVDALDRVAGEEEAVGAERVGELRRGDHDPEPLAVRVARAALAGEAGERLRRLLVDRALGGERLVLDRVLAPGQDDLVLAARRRADLLEERHGALLERRERRARRVAGRATARAARARRRGRGPAGRTGRPRRASCSSTGRRGARRGSGAARAGTRRSGCAAPARRRSACAAARRPRRTAAGRGRRASRPSCRSRRSAT